MAADIYTDRRTQVIGTGGGPGGRRGPLAFRASYIHELSTLIQCPNI